MCNAEAAEGEDDDVAPVVDRSRPGDVIVQSWPGSMGPERPEGRVESIAGTAVAAAKWVKIGNSGGRDFVGLRSFARSDTSRVDRKQLVGLLPDDRLLEGAQIVPGQGHVTSSYLSAALERPFALALIERGRERIGETVYADGVPAEVVELVLYDKEGARRDGRPA